MEQDKQLKEIFLNSAEGASGDFTSTVMNKIYSLSSAPPYYKPMVSPKLKKGFVYAFGAVVTAIVSLCIFIALDNHHIVGWIHRIPPDVNYNKLLLFIFIFWGLFALNMLFEIRY